MRILNGILYDVKFQFRHGFYYAYIFITILYSAILYFLPKSISQAGTTLIIFTDPSVLGAFFIGAVFILEKSQNTLEGLFITPFKIQEYIFSKVVSLTLISVLSSSIIALVSLRDNLNIGVLLTGVILTSVFYTLLGFIIAVYSKTTNQYFINSIVLVVFLSPIVEYLNIFKSEFFMLLPGKASLVIIDGAFKKVDTLTLTFYTVMLLIWCIFAYTALEKAFYRKIVLRIGG